MSHTHTHTYALNLINKLYMFILALVGICMCEHVSNNEPLNNQIKCVILAIVEDLLLISLNHIILYMERIAANWMHPGWPCKKKLDAVRRWVCVCMCCKLVKCSKYLRKNLIAFLQLDVLYIHFICNNYLKRSHWIVGKLLSVWLVCVVVFPLIFCKFY